MRAMPAVNRKLHNEYEKASREMNGVFYAGLLETEIDRFEKMFRKVLANLENE